MFIVAFEGIDAAGKETQVEMLYKDLYFKDYEVEKMSFPRYDTPTGKLIKEMLMSKENISNEALHLLYEVDRYNAKLEIEWLEKEGTDILILDRYLMSNIAFLEAKGMDINWIKNVQKYLIKPDLTIILDIPSTVSFNRKSKGYSENEIDRHEKDLELLTNVRKAYTLSTLDNKLSDQAFLIDANKSMKEVHESIKSILYAII